MAATDLLWGGQLKWVNFDPVAHILNFEINVVEGGVQTTYNLACSGVSDFRFTNVIPDPWSYAEVTEVHVSESPAERWTIEIVLWSEDCEIVCICGDFQVIEWAVS